MLNQKIPRSLRRCSTVFLGALFLLWPALYNGFPLLYPDSMTYLDDGRLVARALFLHQFSPYYGVRSLIYSLAILPFHWNLTAWPIIGLQSFLAAWVLWLVVRILLPKRSATNYLILMVLLSLLTSLSWYADFLMPDVLGPLLYLAIYLLVFAHESLSRAERLSLYAIAWWGVTAHATHLLLALGLCLLLALYAACNRTTMRLRLRGVGGVAAILLLAVVSQMSLYAYLDGKPSLNGDRPPPYLMARILADGPGRLYLQTHCDPPQWLLCSQQQRLSSDQDDFLWGPEGVYSTSSEAEKDRIKKEEVPFVLAAIRAYPRQQLARSAVNFREQLLAFGLYGFDSNPWLTDEFSDVMPKARSRYLQSHQAHDALPLELLTTIQYWTVIASLLLIVLRIFWPGRRNAQPMVGLILVVFSIVVANAAVTGVLSVVDDRYGCRVIWMIPMLAGLIVLQGLQQRERVS